MKQGGNHALEKNNIKTLSTVVANWGAGYAVIKKIYFYGSRVKGTHYEDSDLDIAIELDLSCIDFNKSNLLSFWIYNSRQWEEKLKKLTSMQVDLQLFEPGRSVRVCSGPSILVYEKRPQPHTCE